MMVFIQTPIQGDDLPANRPEQHVMIAAAALHAQWENFRLLDYAASPVTIIAITKLMVAARHAYSTVVHVRMVILASHDLTHQTRHTLGSVVVTNIIVTL